MAKLITDACSAENFKFITESAQGGKKPPMYVIEGVYAVADSTNGNGRSYPYELLKEEIDRFTEEMVKTGRALGELEHPSYAEINPAESAIRILDLWEDNKTWVGKSCILASAPEFGIRGTPKGDILLSLVQYGTKMGFSTRAVGDLNEDETKVTDMKLCTIDCVGNPSIGSFCQSNGDRFVNGILESKNFVISNHGEIYEAPYRKLESRLSKRPNTFITEKRNADLFKAVDCFFKSLREVR